MLELARLAGELKLLNKLCYLNTHRKVLIMGR